VFSTYLWTGNGTLSIPIVNGINLSGKGGLVWMKGRNNVNNNYLYDTVRGVSSGLVSNTTNAAADYQALSAFNSNGFTDSFGFTSSETAVSWTFRKQSKFFDIVTYTGNGTGERAIAHNLGSVPGCVIVKKTSATGSWGVWHRGNGVSAVTYFDLNTTAAGVTSVGNTAFTSATTFTVDGLGPAVGGLNDNGATYVAYLFAHDAGGFGLTGTDNVISCGSFTTDGSGNATVSLGYEPQWVMYKRTNAASNWVISDVMRGSSLTTYAQLYADSSGAEDSGAGPFGMIPNATGFNPTGILTSSTYIYIAIRRGPMALPTTGTQVYSGVLRTGTGSAANVTGAGFPPDLVILERRTDPKGSFSDRLRGSTQLLNSYETATEATDANGVTSFSMDGMAVGTGNNANQSGMNYVYWFLRRYPSVFDEVCYTGDGTTNRSITHNLASTPEFLIVKKRSSPQDWHVYSSGLTTPLNKIIVLNSSNAEVDVGSPFWGVSSTNFSLPASGGGGLNTNGSTYVAYLFATCAGVSKVGGYTGNGTTQTINCGFTGGARFVLIKRTDAAGDWYTYDTARGMTVLTDPYIRLNVNSAEVATLGSVTTVSTGFALNSAVLAAINVSAGTYIFLAIA
jgi:hypothetical protein